ncbi:MFS transporter [Treponema pedis]|uniref:MFS transporter n=1 Tax=Treponema pedis TaxID=409322 RepID=UPI00041ACA61|nr:MFS transporter [Treponema pedis]
MNNNDIVIPLTKNKKTAVILGSIFLMFSVAGFGLSLALLQGRILETMNAMSYFSTLTIFASLGLAILTPIGGKLGDLYGRKNIIIISGTIAVFCGIGMALTDNAFVFITLRLLLGVAQGAFISAPYILMGEINEKKDIPKGMGYLSSAIAVGGFGSSIIAGFLSDRGLLKAAIVFPAIPLLIGIILITLNLPNTKQKKKISIDFLGIIFLTLFLSSLLLSLNYGPKIGWSNKIIIISLISSMLFLFLLIKIEKKSKEPIIPLHLFLNKKYSILLIAGVICYFYQNQMNVYAPLAIQSILNKSATLSGALQLPRTIITMILPIIFGAWLGKRKSKYWIAITFAAGIPFIAFFALSFTNSASSVLLFYIIISLTGIAESFRSVSITPAAQATLQPQELGIGTSLITFMNSISTLIAAAVTGIIFDSNKNNMTLAINNIFMLTAVISFFGILIAVFIVRKQNKNS